jgi:hypothetical protein
VIGTFHLIIFLNVPKEIEKLVRHLINSGKSSRSLVVSQCDEWLGFKHGSWGRKPSILLIIRKWRAWDMESSTVLDIRQLCDIAHICQFLWAHFLTGKMETAVSSLLNSKQNSRWSILKNKTAFAFDWRLCVDIISTHQQSVWLLPSENKKSLLLKSFPISQSFCSMGYYQGFYSR